MSITSKIPTLEVKGLGKHEWGISRARLNIKNRNGVNRYEVAKLTNLNNNKSTLVLLLGHDDETGIYLDFDTREELGLEKGEKVQISATKVRLFSKLLWYLKTKDPMIHIPACLAVLSVALSIIGLLVGFIY